MGKGSGMEVSLWAKGWRSVYGQRDGGQSMAEHNDPVFMFLYLITRDEHAHKKNE